MPQLLMRDAFVTGIESIDAEHRVLIDRFNSLSEAVTNHEPHDLVDLALRALIRETRKHFANEERLLEEHDYRDIDAHRDEHVGLLHQVEQYAARYRAGTLAMNQHMMALLKDWLSDHILVADQAFAAQLTHLVTRDEEPG
jgi:hemerythrin